MVEGTAWDGEQWLHHGSSPCLDQLWKEGGKGVERQWMPRWTGRSLDGTTESCGLRKLGNWGIEVTKGGTESV